MYNCSYIILALLWFLWTMHYHSNHFLQPIYIYLSTLWYCFPHSTLLVECIMMCVDSILLAFPFMWLWNVKQIPYHVNARAHVIRSSPLGSGAPSRINKSMILCNMNMPKIDMCWIRSRCIKSLFSSRNSGPPCMKTSARNPAKYMSRQNISYNHISLIYHSFIIVIYCAPVLYILWAIARTLWHNVLGNIKNII